MWAGNSTFAKIASVVLKSAGAVTFAQSIFTPSPSAMKPNNATNAKTATEEPTGILRITRHPMFASFAMLGVANVMRRGFLSDVIYWGMFPIFFVLGANHQVLFSRALTVQDKRQLQEGTISKEFCEKTSIVPFQAIIEGRNDLKKALKEMEPKASAAALASSIFWL